MSTNKLKQRVKSIAPKSRVAPIPPALVEVRKKNLAPSLALAEQAQAVTVTSEQEYAEASSLRSAVDALIRTANEGIATVLNPLNDARNACLELRRQVTGPLESGKAHLTLEMKIYKLRELEETKDEREEAEAKANDLQQKALDLEAKSKAAKTETAAANLLEKALDTQAQADAVLENIPRGVQVADSVIRTRNVWEAVDLKAIIRAVAKGEIPPDVLIVDRVKVNEYFKKSEEVVSEWPGFKVKPDVIIVTSRGGQQ